MSVERLVADSVIKELAPGEAVLVDPKLQNCWGRRVAPDRVSCEMGVRYKVFRDPKDEHFGKVLFFSLPTDPAVEDARFNVAHLPYCHQNRRNPQHQLDVIEEGEKVKLEDFFSFEPSQTEENPALKVI